MGLARIKAGDRVIVIAGKDKGRIGKVLRVIPAEGRVVVERVNMVKKHQRRTQAAQPGIVTKEAPIAVSKVMLYDDKKGGPARCKVGRDKDGHKVRVSKSSDTVFE
jgi:large subunit ribosomal protein L24